MMHEYKKAGIDKFYGYNKYNPDGIGSGISDMLHRLKTAEYISDRQFKLMNGLGISIRLGAPYFEIVHWKLQQLLMHRGIPVPLMHFRLDWFIWSLWQIGMQRIEAGIIQTTENDDQWTVVVAHLYDLLARPRKDPMLLVGPDNGGSADESKLEALDYQQEVYKFLSSVYDEKIHQAFRNTRLGYARGYLRHEMVILASVVMREMLRLESHLSTFGSYFVDRSMYLLAQRTQVIEGLMKARFDDLSKTPIITSLGFRIEDVEKRDDFVEMINLASVLDNMDDGEKKSLEVRYQYVVIPGKLEMMDVIRSYVDENRHSRQIEPYPGWFKFKLGEVLYRYFQHEDGQDQFQQDDVENQQDEVVEQHQVREEDITQKPEEKQQSDSDQARDKVVKQISRRANRPIGRRDATVDVLSRSRLQARAGGKSVGGDDYFTSRRFKKTGLRTDAQKEQRRLQLSQILRRPQVDIPEQLQYQQKDNDHDPNLFDNGQQQLHRQPEGVSLSPEGMAQYETVLKAKTLYGGDSQIELPVIEENLQLMGQTPGVYEVLEQEFGNISIVQPQAELNEGLSVEGQVEALKRVSRARSREKD